MHDKGKILHTIVTLAMTFGLSYFGYEKYEAHQAEQATTTITIEAPSGESHSHTAVVSQNDINQAIRNAINDVIRQQDTKNKIRFKGKESWD